MSDTSCRITAEDRYRGGRTTRDGFARRFEERTGRNYYASISTGRPRLPRISPKEKVGRPATGVLNNTTKGKGEKPVPPGPVALWPAQPP